MQQPALSVAKRKVLDLLKRRGPATAGELSGRLGLTDVALRQHLLALKSAGWVEQQKRSASGRGRPSIEWSLTSAAAGLYPNRHGELSVGLIEAVRDEFGPEGVERIVLRRADEQVRQYQAVVPGARASLKSRVEALAKLRTAEGYVAEVVTEKPGTYLLVEHHCPICEAATACLGLCGAELEVFQRTLGDEILVERTAHLLSGDTRCAYRITKPRRGEREIG